MIPTEKQHEFTQLTKYAAYRKSKAWDDLVDYIEHPNASMPAFHTDFNDGLSSVYDLFRLPQPPHFWDTFEDKLLQFLKQVIWAQADYQWLNCPNLPRYFIGHYLARNISYFSDSVYRLYLEILLKYEIPESEIWLGFQGYNSLKSPFVLDYILENAEKYLSNVRYNFCHLSLFIEFLIIHKPELVDKFLDKLIIYENPLTGHKSIPSLKIQMKNYLMINPEKHEHNLVNFLSYKSHYEAGFELIHLIENNYLDKYVHEINSYSKTHINMIINDLYPINSKAFANFLDLLFVHNSPQNTFKISGNYLNKFKNPNAESVKIWLKKLKLYDLST